MLKRNFRKTVSSDTKYPHFIQVYTCILLYNFLLPVIFNFLLFSFSARKTDEDKGENKQNVKPLEETDVTKVSREFKKAGGSESDDPPNSQTEIKQNSPIRAKTRTDSPILKRPSYGRFHRHFHDLPHYRRFNDSLL